MGYDYVSGFLDNLVVGDGVLPEDVGRYQAGLVSQVGLAIPLQVGKQPVSQSFKPVVFNFIILSL